MADGLLVAIFAAMQHAGHHHFRLLPTYNQLLVEPSADHLTLFTTLQQQIIDAARCPPRNIAINIIDDWQAGKPFTAEVIPLLCDMFCLDIHVYNGDRVDIYTEQHIDWMSSHPIFIRHVGGQYLPCPQSR